MDDTSFQAAVDEIFLEIEDRIDELPDDIDVDSSGGVLTLAFLDGSSVILSRQVASYEIWIAARSGGYHLAFDGSNWLCRATGETLTNLVDRVFQEQGASGPFN